MSPAWLSGFGVARGIMAGVLLFGFVALWIWVYGAGRRKRYEAAARLPLEDDVQTVSAKGTRS